MMKVSQFWELVFTKVQFNLKAEAKNSYLSYAWWILEPILFVGTFYLVFGVFMNTRTPDFLLFLICGKIPFLWFSRAIQNTTNSIVGGKGLMNQVAIPKIFFPVVVILQDLVKTSVVFILMLLFVWANGIEPHVNWLAIPVIMLSQLIFISAVAILAAMVVPFIPDMKFIISTFVLMLMFGSGIFYDYRDVILPKHIDLYLLNPLANYLSMYRGVLLDNVLPNWYDLMMISAISFLSLFVLVFILKKLDTVYPRLVLE